MAPKGALTQGQKLEKILHYFHESRTCHTLKDLETAVPAATKINKMQIKDLIKELTDNNQVKVEKIGSGNWYWSWAGEELAEKQNAIMKLRTEEVNLKNAIVNLQGQHDSLRLAQTQADENPRYHDLSSQIRSLEAVLRELGKEKDFYDNAVFSDFEHRRQEHENLLNASNQLSDNIDAVESWLLRAQQGDRMALEGIRMECYGDAYNSGELLEVSE